MSSNDTAEDNAEHPEDKVKRQFKRKDVDQIPVRIECLGDTFEGWLEDVSKGGLRVQCEKDLPERGSIKIHIPQGTDSDKEMHVDGIICWTRNLSESGVQIIGKQKDL